MFNSLFPAKKGVLKTMLSFKNIPFVSCSLVHERTLIHSSPP